MRKIQLYHRSIANVSFSGSYNAPQPVSHILHSASVLGADSLTQELVVTRSQPSRCSLRVPDVMKMRIMGKVFKAV